MKWQAVTEFHNFIELSKGPHSLLKCRRIHASKKPMFYIFYPVWKKLKATISESPRSTSEIQTFLRCIPTLASISIKYRVAQEND